MTKSPTPLARQPLKLAFALLLSACVLPAQAKAPSKQAAEHVPSLSDVPINAKHVLVLDEGSGKVLKEKQADSVVPIASLTKLMTAMVVLDAKSNMQEVIRIDSADRDTLKHSLSFLPVGAQLTRQDALTLALMASENRAAAALARTFPGGLAAFQLAVSAKIRALGLTHTQISEATGLSPQNTSTAIEVAKIAAAAARYPAIADITSDKKATIPVSGRKREFHNTNRLVGKKGWDIRLSKTGYTEEAGRCLTMRMLSGGKNVTVVLLDADGSAARLQDAGKIRRSLEKARG
ncbi:MULTISPECIES: serine hydrolase [Roseateles]|uniref:Serine hydrolase n=1 Tax=Roseateles albus TaxID=2987525 RepID=A0ABT5K8L2_9BURK|nr:MULTISPECIES: serine hydrolase [Roseateles]MCV2360660.1 serine hydrolase [Paucibacter sp. TC2R-5]MDC8770293.1 serine hydrolase [Roseateles albus]